MCPIEPVRSLLLKSLNIASVLKALPGPTDLPAFLLTTLLGLIDFPSALGVFPCPTELEQQPPVWPRQKSGEIEPKVRMVLILWTYRPCY